MSEAHLTRERGIVLTRVSDPQQSGASSQLTGCRRLAGQHGVEVAAEVSDDGVSGDDLDREGIARTLALLREAHQAGDPIGWLITDQSDRLSRADSIDTSEVLAKMRRLGVRKVATPARIFDLHNNLDRTLLLIEADHKNNPYLKDLGRRSLNGMLEAARQGYWTGQKPPFGYKVVRTPGEHGGRRRKSGRLAIDEGEGPVVRELFRRYLGGESTYDLMNLLSVKTGRRWTRTGVAGILRHEIYVGVKVFGKDTRGKHARLRDGAAVILGEGEKDVRGDAIRITGYPAIIDPETFAAVQERLAAGTRRSQKKGNQIQPLSGLCHCGACGAEMYCVSGDRGGRGHVVCKNRKLQHYDRCPGTRFVRSREVIERVLAVLAERLLEGDVVANLVRLAGEAEDEARAAREAAERSARRSLDAAERKLATARRRLAEAPDDLLEEYQRLVRELKEEKVAAEAELSRLRAEQPPAGEGDADLFGRWLAACRDACRGASLEGADPPTQNAILKVLVARVVIHPPPANDDRRRWYKGRQTAGRIEVELPEWLNVLLAGTARPLRSTTDPARRSPRGGRCRDGGSPAPRPGTPPR